MRRFPVSEEASETASLATNGKNKIEGDKWRCYTRACQVKWPGWKIHRPGSACLLLCFGLVIVWTENKNFTISDHWPLYLFYFDSETISAALVAFVFWGQRLKKAVSFFGEKVHLGDWIEDVLTSKLPGSLAALAPPLKVTVKNIKLQIMNAVILVV